MQLEVYWIMGKDDAQTKSKSPALKADRIRILIQVSSVLFTKKMPRLISTQSQMNILKYMSILEKLLWIFLLWNAAFSVKMVSQ